VNKASYFACASDSGHLVFAKRKSNFACYLFMLVILCLLPLCSAADSVSDFLLGYDEPSPLTGVNTEVVTNYYRSALVDSSDTITSEDSAYSDLFHLLLNNGFQNVAIHVEDNTRIYINASHPRISQRDRMIGRVARFADVLLPSKFETVNICEVNFGAQCSGCFEFSRSQLRRYFKKLISRWQLSQHMRYSNCPSYQSASLINALDLTEGALSAVRQAAPESGSFIARNDVIDAAGAKRQSLDNDLFTGFTLLHGNYYNLNFEPLELGSMISDNQGDLYPDLRSKISLRVHFFSSLSAYGAVSGRYDKPQSYENVESAHLPIVSDFDEHRRANDVFLEQLFLEYKTASVNGQFALRAGYVNERYGGIFSQAFIPTGSTFAKALDFRFGKVFLRDIDKPTGFQDLRGEIIVAGIWLDPVLISGDIGIYVGRFLAGDHGARLEYSFTFKNGISAGFWYGNSKGGELEKPEQSERYHNWGVTLELPFNALRNRDTKKRLRLEYIPRHKNTGLLSPNLIDREHSRNHAPYKPLNNFGQ